MKDALDLITEALTVDDCTGDLDCITGLFTRLTVKAEENVQDWIADHDGYAHEVAISEGFDWESLVGEWVVTYNDQGHNFPVKFDTAELADAAYAELEAAYSEWADQEGDA